MNGATCSSGQDCCDGQGLVCKTFESGWSGCTAEEDA